MTTKPKAVRMVILLNSARELSGGSGADCSLEQRGHRTPVLVKLQGQRFISQTSSVWLRAPLDEPYAVLAKLLQGRDHIVHGCDRNKASAAGYTPRQCQQQLLRPVQRGLGELLCRSGACTVQPISWKEA